MQHERRRTIHAEDARLVDGFHAFEAGNAIRWTNGDAALPAALFDGMTDSVLLVAQLGAATQYLDEGD